LDRAAAEALRQRLETAATNWRGSVLVTTSRRTPPEVAVVLLAEYSVPGRSFGFGAGGGPSPYPRLLAAGDVFVVTADSASMLADAVATGRPVLAFANPAQPATLPFAWRLSRRFGAGGPAAESLLGRLYRCLLDLGLLYGPRRLDLVLQRLYREGIAQPLPDTPMPAPPHPPTRPAAAGLDQVVARIRRLMGEG
jgi:hypothetical protein